MTIDKWHLRFMEFAKQYSTFSKDPSRKIGAVAVNPIKKILLSGGYNGFPRGILDIQERYDDRPLKYKYVVHAEMNAIYNATLNGVSLDGASLYVWGLPVCSECAKGIIQVGIRKVYWSASEEIPPQWQESVNLTQQMFNEAGIEFNYLETKE